MERGTLGHTCLSPDHKAIPVAPAAQCPPVLHRGEEEFGGTRRQRQSICSAQILSSPLESPRKESGGEPTSIWVYGVESFQLSSCLHEA